MATQYANGQIVTNGLVLSLDAADRNSYVSGNTTWRDLSQNRNNGTLTNGPTFNSSNGGSIVFDGSDDQVNCGSINLGIGAANKSMCAWIFPTSYPKLVSPLADQQNGSSGYAFWLWNTGKLVYWPLAQNDVFDNGSLSVTLNRWNFVSITYNFSGKSASFYYNGSLSSTRTHTGTEVTPAAGVNLNIGYTLITPTTYVIGGRMAIVKLYNRELTASEVLQNYNATKSRFGL